MHAELANLWLFVLTIAKLSITTGFGFAIAIAAVTRLLIQPKGGPTRYEVDCRRTIRADDVFRGGAASLRRRLGSDAALPWTQMQIEHECVSIPHETHITRKAS